MLGAASHGKKDGGAQAHWSEDRSDRKAVGPREGRPVAGWKRSLGSDPLGALPELASGRAQLSLARQVALNSRSASLAAVRVDDIGDSPEVLRDPVSRSSGSPDIELVADIPEVGGYERQKVIVFKRLHPGSKQKPSTGCSSISLGACSGWPCGISKNPTPVTVTVSLTVVKVLVG